MQIPILNKISGIKYHIIMKRRLSSFLLLSLFSLISCIKNEERLFTSQVAEFDATTWNANSAGVTYPILTRIPAFNRAVSTSLDSTLRRLSSTIRVRVNLVGPTSKQEQTVGYSTFASPITTVSFPATITGQTPTTAAGTLAVSDAVAGTHYTALSGMVTIPVDSSFGYINIQILNPGATAGQGRFVGLQLNELGTVKSSVNYSQLGLVIDQR